MSKVLVHEEEGFDRIATGNCYIFGFHEPVTYDATAIELADGSSMSPGERFTFIGGDNTSASHRRIDLVDGFLEYAGRVIISGFKLLCFNYYLGEGQLFVPDESYACSHYGFIQLDDSSKWMFSTPGIASRLVETSKVKRYVG